MMGAEHWWGSGMWIFPILFLMVLLTMVYLMFGRGRPPSMDLRRPELPARSETALEILQKRYARGDIDREEFQQMQKDLS